MQVCLLGSLALLPPAPHLPATCSPDTTVTLKAPSMAGAAASSARPAAVLTAAGTVAMELVTRVRRREASAECARRSRMLPPAAAAKPAGSATAAPLPPMGRVVVPASGSTTAAAAVRALVPTDAASPPTWGPRAWGRSWVVEKRRGRCVPKRVRGPALHCHPTPPPPSTHHAGQEHRLCTVGHREGAGEGIQCRGAGGGRDRGLQQAAARAGAGGGASQCWGGHCSQVQQGVEVGGLHGATVGSQGLDGVHGDLRLQSMGLPKRWAAALARGQEGCRHRGRRRGADTGAGAARQALPSPAHRQRAVGGGGGQRRQG